jgi:hypothetical protein
LVGPRSAVTFDNLVFPTAEEAAAKGNDKALGQFAARLALPSALNIRAAHAIVIE